VPDGGTRGAAASPDTVAGTAHSGSRISYQVEPLIRLLCYDNLARITFEQWSAIALDRQDVPLVVDWEAYLAAERAGTWRAFTARDEAGQLLGYIAFTFQRPIRYRTTVYAQEDTIWIVPDAGAFRRALIWRGLWREALKALPRPCKVFGKVRLGAADARLMRNTIGKRHGAQRVLFLMMGAVLRSLGLRPVEVVFSAFLK
jgi:hypothetical protein